MVVMATGSRAHQPLDAAALAAAQSVGQAHAEHGHDLADCLDALAAQYEDELSPGLVRAAAEAWAEEAVRPVQRRSCEDPLTGLAGPEHLRTRLAEVYREAGRRGTDVQQEYTFVAILAEPGPVERHSTDRFDQMLRRVTEGGALRRVFSGGEVIAALNSRLTVALCARRPGLVRQVHGLPHFLASVTGAGTRVWLEPLPSRFTDADQLIMALREVD